MSVSLHPHPHCTTVSIGVEISGTAAGVPCAAAVVIKNPPPFKQDNIKRTHLTSNSPSVLCDAHNQLSTTSRLHHAIATAKTCVEVKLNSSQRNKRTSCHPYAPGICFHHPGPLCPLTTSAACSSKSVLCYHQREQSCSKWLAWPLLMQHQFPQRLGGRQAGKLGPDVITLR